MNFGKNLQTLRKANQLSQEELAEKLNVSRQAISKWESGTGLPEMDKLLQLCEMFNCKMDDLVRGELSPEKSTSSQHTSKNPENLKYIYNRLMNRFSIWISLAIGLIIFGVSPLLYLSDFGSPWVDYGLVILLIFVAIAVPIFVTQGIKVGNFKEKHPHLDISYTEAEVDGANGKFTTLMASAIGIILTGLVVFMALMASNVFGTESAAPVAVFILFVAIGAPLFVLAGIRKGKYDIVKYNHENSPEFVKNSKKIGAISGIIMMIATMIYLSLGFICDLWETAWIVFPLGGITCGIVSTILEHSHKHLL